jgi:hypothetical protein
MDDRDNELTILKDLMALLCVGQARIGLDSIID